MSFKLKVSKPAQAAGTSNYPDPVKDTGYPYLYGTTFQAGNSWVQGAEYGLVGGNTSAAGLQIVAAVKIAGNTADANGYIIKQRGRHTYLVQDSSGNQGVCTLVNTDVGNLTANTMSVQATRADSSTFYVSTIKDKLVLDFANVAYLITPLAGSRSLTPPAGASYATGGVVTLNIA